MSEPNAEALQRCVAEVVARFDGASAPRSAEVGNGAVLPLLQAMGWTVFDTREVRPRVQVGANSVDFALGEAGGRTHVFIEIHGQRREPAQVRDALARARRADVGLLVLTSGLAWRLFVAEADRRPDRPVFDLELGDGDITECAATMRGYLGRQTVLSGEALRRALGAGALVPAWQALATRGDSLLVELLADEVRDHVGLRPRDAAVKDFLRELVVPSTDLRPPPRQTPAARVRGRRRPRVRVALHGQSENFGTFKDALLFVLRQLQDREAGFLESCSAHPRFQTRTRRYLARNPNEIYPDSPELAEHNEWVADGWYLGTNTNNRQKGEQARAACEVAGLRFGTDLTVEPHSP